MINSNEVEGLFRLFLYTCKSEGLSDCTIKDYNFKVGASKKVNTIQLSLDVLNLGNLLNSDWGLIQQPNSVQPIGVNVVNKVPTYTFNGNQTKTFSYDASLASRWQAQFGIRYIF